VTHKEFGQRKEDSTEVVEPVTFDLADEKNIECRKKVNGKLLIELVGKVESGSVTKQAEGILQVFDVVVLTNDGEDPDDYTGKREGSHTVVEIQEAAEDEVILGIDPTSSHGRLQHVLDSPDTEIDINELAELVGWLVEQYTARPTGSAANSRGGAMNGRGTSRRARRSQERTIAKETQVGSSTSPTESSLSSV